MELRQLDAIDRTVSLGEAGKGFRGRVVCLLPLPGSGRLAPEEMERRLIEMGFIEGVEVSVIHEGPFGRDPIAVRVGGSTVALRRRDAMAILTE
ncbi:FeoA family protein [Mangrovicoccus sp. HB161399]|uniref:FeoA family protein n=1 Tax=Mangrovicoccus sp. HB161399 TaxID=2720392 RepID=UPI001552924D|nr:FeoA family protein [Mangrovicoccus sp. HB161399]